MMSAATTKVLGGVGLIVSLVFLATSTAAACSRTALAGTGKSIPSSGKISQNLLNKAILFEVNYERCRAGLPTLKSEARLTRAAYKHSKWMAKYSNLTHRSNIAGYSSPKARMKSTGIKFKTGSENISRMYRYQLGGRQVYVKDRAACIFSDSKGKPIQPHSYATLAHEAVQLWVKSPQHRKNLMDNRMRITSTAAAVDPKGRNCGEIYLTQDFLG